MKRSSTEMCEELREFDNAHGSTEALAWGKESTFSAEDQRLDPWVRKICRRRKWQPTPIFLPGEFHGQKSLVGYSPWDHKELDMTEL